jgi:hypothetical protein
MNTDGKAKSGKIGIESIRKRLGEERNWPLMHTDESVRSGGESGLRRARNARGERRMTRGWESEERRRIGPSSR